MAYQQFTERRLLLGETVDVYLTDLRKLSVPFGGMNDWMLGCAFVAGWFDEVGFFEQHPEWINYRPTSCWPEPKPFARKRNEW